MRSAVLIGSLFTLLLWGCSPLYFSEPINSPVFTKAGEAEVSYAGGTSSGGGWAQGAYSLMDHFALLGSYEFNDRSQNQQSSVGGAIEYFGVLDASQSLQFGGLLFPSGSSAIKVPLRFDIIAGMGTGYDKYFHYDTIRFDFFNHSNHDYLSGRIDFRRYYLEGAIGLTDRGSGDPTKLMGFAAHGSIALSIRLEYLDMYRVNTTTAYTSELPETQMEPDFNDRGRKRNFNAELAFSTSVGLAFVRFYQQVGLYLQPIAFNNVSIFPLQVNFGVGFEF